MENFKYVIVGGGAAGTTCAETLRQNDSEGSIAIVSDEPYLFYSRVLLSKGSFLLEKKPFDQVWLKKEEWYQKNKISFLGGKKAVSLDSSKKILVLNDKKEIHYDKLLLALGASARRWNVKGSNKEGIFYLRSLGDAEKLMPEFKNKKRAITIGSGSISFEVIEVLRQAGIKVAEVMLERYFWEPMLDETGGRMTEKALVENGVEIFHQSEVEEVLGKNSVTGVLLKDGRKIDCDMIVCGIGVFCELDWLKNSGVKTNKGILADSYLQTDSPDVFAAGDVSEYEDAILEERVILGSWMNAREQGKTAALNMLGRKQIFQCVSFYISHGFGLNITYLGDIRSLPDRVMISRGSMELNSYCRLILKNNRILGATLVNRPQELMTIVKLIQNKIDISQKQKELADASFDLQKLL